MTSFKNCEENFDDTLTICQMLQSATLNCSEPVVKVITDCLPEKARDLPILSIKSFVSVAGYLCSILGESIFGTFQKLICLKFKNKTTVKLQN